MFLSLEDAVACCMRELFETTKFSDWSADEINQYKDIVESEMEQKCWLSNCKDPALKRIGMLIEAINPKEIADQIELDYLTSWCDIIRAELYSALHQITKHQSTVEYTHLSNNVTEISTT